MEEWRDIEGFEGYYQVSNTGKVKSLERMKWCGLNGGCYVAVPEKILEGVDDGHGYLRVKLCKGGKDTPGKVHRLVAQAFLENPYNLPEVNHKNEDKTDNRVENLEWCSKLYNINYGTRNIRAGKSNSKANTNNPKTSKPVIGINKVSGLIMEFPSLMEAERQTGINHSHICKCLKGKGYKSAGGYYWIYSDSEEVANEQE